MKTFLVLALLLPFLGQSEVRIADTLAPIEQWIPLSVGQGTLILIDIGDTLIRHSNPLVYKEHRLWMTKWFEQNAPHVSKQEIQSLIVSIKNDNDSWALTDLRWPSLITQARQKGANVVAFSKVVPDPIVRAHRQQRIKELGVNLNKDIPFGFSNVYRYENGIVETELEFKGACLVELLKYLETKPSQIVFIENEKEQVDNVNQVCEELGIPCMVFHFIATQKAPSLDPEVADDELRSFIFPKT